MSEMEGEKTKSADQSGNACVQTFNRISRQTEKRPPVSSGLSLSSGRPGIVVQPGRFAFFIFGIGFT